ncbi:MAG: hypothetical protein E7B29_21930, partial [Mixta calida]|nr:hypothetical protein [Mixta calida]
SGGGNFNRGGGNANGNNNYGGFGGGQQQNQGGFGAPQQQQSQQSDPWNSSSPAGGFGGDANGEPPF